MINQNDKYWTMWTVQSDRVLETLMRDGRYFVKKRYITEKYEGTAWIFQEVYTFFNHKAEQLIMRPEEEEKMFALELKRQGITYSSDVFEKPFYPMLKKKILKSWERLFTEKCTEKQDCQGAAWLLKKEWLQM